MSCGDEGLFLEFKCFCRLFTNWVMQMRVYAWRSNVSKRLDSMDCEEGSSLVLKCLVPFGVSINGYGDGSLLLQSGIFHRCSQNSLWTGEFVDGGFTQQLADR
jgi:hypothetical protein